MIDGLMQLFGPRSFQQPHYQVRVHEITEDQFSIGDYHFDFLSLPPAGNHGLRFQWGGQTYAITGDSHFHAEEIELLTHSDLAIIDAGHISDAEIVELAVTTQARRIICSHLYRTLDGPQLQQQARQRGYQGTIQVGYDFLSFTL
ncbi:MBL fold metallo-hydrolase [Dictyobacter kobayashii]|uniref:Metallo-beta-lactamase domain-containing protein n=1 Tax=Dictyobacter kobayashii TaxID=2014872 RepID=A0A402ALA5_9CHLR|nr:MBL fold metallo-hydrolase [Dictyobacter kobayashii]GCE19815.1 hypothetical protein KDK_36150 [Dictyobacter kobayashii]